MARRYRTCTCSCQPSDCSTRSTVDNGNPRALRNCRRNVPLLMPQLRATPLIPRCSAISSSAATRQSPSTGCACSRALSSSAMADSAPCVVGDTVLNGGPHMHGGRLRRSARRRAMRVAVPDNLTNRRIKRSPRTTRHGIGRPVHAPCSPRAATELFVRFSRTAIPTGAMAHQHVQRDHTTTHRTWTELQSGRSVHRWADAVRVSATE